MLTRTSSMMCPSAAQMVPNFMVYPPASAIRPRLHEMTLSTNLNASGPLTLITEIAPVPGTVAGAYMVSSFLMYIFFVLDPYDSLRSLRMTIMWLCSLGITVNVALLLMTVKSCFARDDIVPLMTVRM